MKKLFYVLFVFIMVYIELLFSQNRLESKSFNMDSKAIIEVTFREGMGGYYYTVDAYLYQSQPNNSHSDETYVVWDNDAGAQRVGLIRFNNIFGSEAGQIPYGSTIVSAALEYYIEQESGTGSAATAYESLVDWTETVTWNTFGGDAGVQADEYNNTPVTTVYASSIGTHSIDVKTSLVKWSNQSATNYGWIIIPGGDNSVYINSSEHATTTWRPLLRVNYTPPSSEVEVTFREGANGYAYTFDTYLHEGEANISHGDETYVVWDNDAGAQRVGLIRFNNIFGNAAGQIPYGAAIVSATLEYYIEQESGTGSTATAYESLVDWAEAVTWNTFGGDAGVQPDEYNNTPVATVNASSIGPHSIDVKTSLVKWSNQSATNYGWIIIPGGDNSVYINSSEHATTTWRPLLRVNYTPPSTQVEVTFREDVSSYSGTLDTYIYELQPSSSYGTDNYVVWDNDAGAQRVGLIRFNNIFGSEAGQIPYGSAIVSATLEYYIELESGTGSAATAYESLVDWAEAVTWNTFGGDAGVQPDEYNNTPVATVNASSIGPHSIDVKTSLVKWSNQSATNYGWIIIPGGDNSVYINSSEHATTTWRPLLRVIYTVPSSEVIIMRSSPPNNGELNDFAQLQVELSNIQNENYKVVFYIKNKNTNATFRWVGLGDTQFYTDTLNDLLNGTHEMFGSQINWIKANKNIPGNPIVYVYHVGDIIENNERANSDTTSPFSPYEYNIASSYLYQLDNAGIPYGLEVAGHDRRNKKDNDYRAVYFNQYFGVDHFSGYPYYGGSYNGGVKGQDNNNHYDLISAGGLDFIIIYIEHDNHQSPQLPATNQIDWADSILKRYPDRRGVLVSHDILAEQDAGQYDPGQFSETGLRIYNKLKDNPNLFLMLCGHVCPNGGTGEYRRTDFFKGSLIHTVCANYQDFMNGGDGWFRILTFNTQNKTIYFQTHSNYNIPRWRTGDESQFTLSYPEYLNLDTVPNVGNNQTAGLTYEIFNSGQEYEWYVEAISPAGVKKESEHWTFRYGTPTSYTIELKAFIEGFYNGTTMVPDVATVELRKASDYSFAESNSVNLSSSGTGLVNFSNVSDNAPYYVVLKHRNSIETWSKFWQIFNKGFMKYDFTVSSNRAYGNNLKLKGTKWCIYGGEIANDDEYIDGDDVSAAFNAQGLSGYIIQDVTGDDFVDGDDVTLAFNNQGVGAITPVVVKSTSPIIKVNKKGE